MDVFQGFGKEQPTLDRPRSRFPFGHTVKTTINSAGLYPLDWFEVLPGDTCVMDTSALVRALTPMAPVMDNSYIDLYWFFVPYRILWKHWEELVGANKSTYWDDPTEWVTPYLGSTVLNVTTGSLGDYLGLPIGPVTSTDFNPFPFIAYYKIYDEWFRNENVEAPHSIVDTFYNAGNGASVTAGGGSNVFNTVLSSYRYRDLFSDCLPAPQKGDAVELPLGTSAPVVPAVGHGNPAGYFYVSGVTNSVNPGASIVTKDALSPSSNSVSLFPDGSGATASVFPAFTASGLAQSLSVDLSHATAANVNELRLAFQSQRILEALARGGSRYTEILQNLFGVHPSDARLQRPEYLGGSHTPIGMSQVPATASTNATENQNVGDVGAFSVTGFTGGRVVKSFDEFGLVMCLATIRVKHTYSQGLDKKWTHRRRFDFYWPQLANIGEQAVKKSELYYGNGTNSDVFGFQEAWYEYRYQPDKLTGFMRTDVPYSLGGVWTYGDKYNAAPGLNSAFLHEQMTNIKQTLIDQTASPVNPNMFKVDLQVNAVMTRPMPVYSVPGLIDHH